MWTILCLVVFARNTVKCVLLGLLLVSISTVASAQSTVVVRVSSARMMQNDGVGTEWSFTVAAQVGEAYATNYTVPYGPNRWLTVEVGEPFRLEAVVVAHEPHPDVGREVVDVDLEALERGRSYGVRIPVTVEEDRGPDAGRTAQWVFVITVTTL